MKRSLTSAIYWEVVAAHGGIIVMQDLRYAVHPEVVTTISTTFTQIRLGLGHSTKSIIDEIKTRPI